MVDYTPSEKGMTIRQPSTANLMIDSADRDTTPYPLCWNFTIQKRQSILNGFFTRIATTEVVLDWAEPNINFQDGTSVLLSDFSLDISGVTYNYDLPIGFYTVADLATGLSAGTPVPAYPANTVLTVGGFNGLLLFAATIGGASRSVVINPTALTEKYFSGVLPFGNNTIVLNVDLRPTKFLDFVSNDLTYNQDLKDGSTSTIERNVLCRWYFDWDNPPTYDAIGFPILMGYRNFTLRRLFNPPKQIQWSPNMPLGNLSFQVYGDNGEQAGGGVITDWRMTLQISET
jgi:hypothetical protein